jgi:hypothetical protein
MASFTFNNAHQNTSIKTIQSTEEGAESHIKEEQHFY